MSRTDKDAPKRLLTAEYWDKWYRPRNPKPKRGKALARAREYANGPGGVKCSCCGVVKGYKAKDRRNWKSEVFSYVSLSM